jgi:hypothetical protein
LTLHCPLDASGALLESACFWGISEASALDDEELEDLESWTAEQNRRP